MGAGVSEVMALQAPPELLGIHVNLPGTIPPEIAKALQCGDPPPPGLSADERRAYEQLQVLFAKRRAYAQMMGTRPQTLYGLADSPVGLAAWLLDHGDGYGQPAAAIISAAPAHGQWTSCRRPYTRRRPRRHHPLLVDEHRDFCGALLLGNRFNLYNAANVAIPAAVSVFPGENYQAPRSWAERAYHKLIYYNRVDKGGHYAAWEQPQLFCEEVRAGFKPLRKS